MKASGLKKAGILRALLAAGLFALAAGGSAEAKIVISEGAKYYAISGRSGIELGKAMLTGGGQATRINHAIAATATRFSFKDPVIKVEGGRCVLKDVHVVLDITFHFPKWNGRNSASPGMRGAWDQFYSELLRHERQHGLIARNYAKKIEGEMRGMYGNVSLGCRDFGNNARARFNTLAGQLKAEQVAFDAREQLSSSKISQLQLRLLKTK